MSRAARAVAPLDRASLLRHLAICAAASAAWVMREELPVRADVLWVFGLAVAINVAVTRASDARGWMHVARGVSTLFGVAGWGALVFLTGGVQSPFIAGFWLEIGLSAIVFAPKGTLATTAAAAVALWAQQAAIGLGPAAGRLALQTAFIAAIGALTFYASWRASKARHELSLEGAALSRRLRGLEEELAASRALNRVGEKSARLAHSLKNTVHSLRGFARLIEGQGEGTRIQRQALDGLRLAIDGLEDTARETLLPPREPSDETTAAELQHTLDDVIQEMARTHASLRWVKPAGEGLPGVALPPPILREVLLILAQNAAEASGASGEVVLRADVQGGRLCVAVQDRGPGFAFATSETGEAFLRPGLTTKPTGSGFGLFLARRLVESRGGSLTVGRAPQGGALVAVQLPLQRT
jgi:signal transduction histidine kinase